MFEMKRDRFLSRLVPCVLACTALGCGEISDSPGVGGSAGSGAGRAGAAGAAGAGGTTLAPRGGAGGSLMAVIDAGPVGADAAAGSGGMPSTTPSGCPEPTPIPAPGQVIAIQSVNVVTSEIVLRNVSQTSQSIQLGRQGWQWCGYPRYWAILDQETVKVLAPGETLPFIAINNTSGVAPLFASEGELAMYPVTGVFEEYEYMQAFVAWGDIQAFRESYAVQKGLWVYDQRIQIRPGHAGFIATGPTNMAAGYTSVRAACLVVPPNP